ncbi:MAG: 23S rRNA (guanosine(2251)-2'-O)-methyltransferase RlmB [Chlamydiota bacterium]
MKKKKSNPKHQRSRMIMGKNCVMEVVRSDPRRLIKVYLSAKDKSLWAKIEDTGAQVVGISKPELNEIAKSESHQGIVAFVQEKKQPTLEDYLDSSFENDRDVILVLDSIYDPQNLGALMRAAECFGVGAVMWSKNRGTDLTPVVSKTSVGASELVDIIRVSNLAEAVKRCKKDGYRVVTAEVGKEAVSLDEFSFPEKTLIIMGSEGEGVRDLLSKQANHKVYIPMKGAIDSLNVSQATAVMLYKWAQA